MRQIRRICTALLVLVGAVVIVPAFGGTASAHHSNITASVSCSGTVSWTATSWATGPSGTNSDIRVFKKIGNDPQVQIGAGVFNNANNYQFSGTFAWPANTASMVISSKPYAAWGNGVVSPTGSSVTITKPVNCPSQPGVTQAVSCVNNTSPGNGEGKVVLTLTNDAGPYGSSAVFKVYPIDSAAGSTTHTVASGATKTITLTSIADGNHSVKITVVGPPDIDKTQYFTIECDHPVPSASHSTVACVNGDGQVVVTLTNAGGEAVVFDVTNPKSPFGVEHVTVNANNFVTRTFSGFGDGTYTVTIKIGVADYSQTFMVDCDHPAPSASAKVVCANHDGSVTITLLNTGTEAVTFHVTNPLNGHIDDVLVGIGGSVDVTYGGFSDGLHTVAVTADGHSYDQTFTVNCDLPPSYSHTETCVNGDGSVDVTMTNDGDDVNAVFVLNDVSHTLAPGASLVVTLSPYADGTNVIPLTVNGLEKNITIVVDCDRPGEPAVDISTVCENEDGTVSVTLKNIGGQLPLTFIVEGVSHVVPADDTVVVPVTGVLDGPRTIHISQGATDFSKYVDFSCDTPPTASYVQTCVNGDNGISNGQVVVTVTNNGDDVGVVFTVNGQATAPVPPKQSINVTIDGLTDGPHNIDVLAGTVKLGFAVISIACDHPGLGTIEVLQECADHDGRVTVTLNAEGGELPVIFTVQGVIHSVLPNTSELVVISGLNDGSTVIPVFAGTTDLSFTATVHCDAAPQHNFSQACVNYDDLVSVFISNPGDDTTVTFRINGVYYPLLPGESETVVVGPLADGINTITLFINDVAQPDIVVESDCNPTFGVVAVCNSATGEGATHWFTVTNTESTDVTVTWNGGSAVVPAGQSTVIGTASTSLVLFHNGQRIAQAAATEANCDRTVTFTKALVGAPTAYETYSIRVSRLVNGTYVEETTFNINAGESKIIHLPSTMDPAGIDYKFEEIVKGSASTTTVSPDQLKLSGHLGETVNVAVTNGYASVEIDKASFTPTVVPGGQITYTLQATNTGGLTLNPVVITDRLPSMMDLVSASVAGGAGTCALTEAARPQLLTCTMTGALAPGATTSVITLVVDVDSTVVAGTSVLNQAMVHGAFEAGAVMTGLGGGTVLSCVPVVANTVCDLSAVVGVPVSNPIVASSPPVPTVASDAIVTELPRTGAGHLQEMIVLAFGGILLGGAMLIGRRRPAPAE